MGLHYNLTRSLHEMQVWRAAVSHDCARDHERMIYDTGILPVVAVTPLNQTRPVYIPIDPREHDPVMVEEVLADSLFARSLIENTRIPRQNFLLCVVWTLAGAAVTTSQPDTL